MRFFSGFAIDDDPLRSMELSASRADGDPLEGGAIARVAEQQVDLATQFCIAPYAAGWHLEMPKQRPLALLEDGLQFAPPGTRGLMRAVWIEGERDGRTTDLGWHMISLTWGRPKAWRPAAPLAGRAPVLPATVALLFCFGGPGELVPDVHRAAKVLADAGREPGGPRRTARQRRRQQSPDAGADELWSRPEEAERFALGGLLEAALEGAEAGTIHLAPLFPEAAPVAAFGAPLEGSNIVTLWEALDADGEVCGLSAVASLAPELPDPELGPWTLGEGLPPSRSHSSIGRSLTREADLHIRPEVWTGEEFEASEVWEDGQRFTWLEQYSPSPLGQITFPSREIYVADPLASDTGGQTLELQLSHPGPFPVVAISNAVADYRGLLVVLSPGMPERWVEAPAREGGRAEPIVNSGSIAILDLDALPWLRGLSARPMDYTWTLAAPATLLRATVDALPVVASLSGFGGDVPIWVHLGLGADEQPVAVLLGTDDLTAPAP